MNLYSVFSLSVYSYDTQRYGMVFIYDMSGSKYANFDYELSIKILNMLKVCTFEQRHKKTYVRGWRPDKTNKPSHID